MPRLTHPTHLGPGPSSQADASSRDCHDSRSLFRVFHCQLDRSLKPFGCLFYMSCRAPGGEMLGASRSPDLPAPDAPVSNRGLLNLYPGYREDPVGLRAFGSK